MFTTLICLLGSVGFAEMSSESALTILNKPTWTERGKSIRELYREFYYKKNQLVINDKRIKQKLVQLLAQDQLLQENYIAAAQKQGKGYDQAYQDFIGKYSEVNFGGYVTNLALLVRIYKDPATIPVLFECPYNGSADLSDLAYIGFGKGIFNIVLGLTKNGSERQKFVAYNVLAEWMVKTLEKSDFVLDLRLDSNEISQVKGVLVAALVENKIDGRNITPIGWGLSKIIKHEKDETEKRKLKKHLIKLFKHDNLGVRREAVEFLGKCGNEEDIQYLKELVPGDTSTEPAAKTGKDIKDVEYPVQKKAEAAIEKIRARLKGTKDESVVFDPGAD